MAAQAQTSTRHRRPAPRELEVWRAFLRAHARLTRRLEADLLAEQDLPLAPYDARSSRRPATGCRRPTWPIGCCSPEAA